MDRTIKIILAWLLRTKLLRYFVFLKNHQNTKNIKLVPEKEGTAYCNVTHRHSHGSLNGDLMFQDLPIAETIHLGHIRIRQD